LHNGNSSLFKWSPSPFQRGIITKVSKIG
jgi:hypothetical protein